VAALGRTKRVLLSFVAAGLCLAVGAWTGPIATWLLIIAAFGFILDGVTMMWPQGDNLTKYRQ